VNKLYSLCINFN